VEIRGEKDEKVDLVSEAQHQRWRKSSLHGVRDKNDCGEEADIEQREEISLPWRVQPRAPESLRSQADECESDEKRVVEEERPPGVLDGQPKREHRQDGEAKARC
jgi:hypothetical protein